MRRLNRNRSAAISIQSLVLSSIGTSWTCSFNSNLTCFFAVLGKQTVWPWFSRIRFPSESHDNVSPESWRTSAIAWACSGPDIRSATTRLCVSLNVLSLLRWWNKSISFCRGWDVPLDLCTISDTGSNCRSLAILVKLPEFCLRSVLCFLESILKLSHNHLTKSESWSRMKKVTEYLQYLFDFFWHNFKKKLFTINSILHYLSYILFQTSTKFWPRISTRFRITAAALFPTIGKTRCSRPSLDTLCTAAVDLGHRVQTATC